MRVARALAAGDGHGCPALADGRVPCWGSNAAGQLGDGSTTSPALGVLVVPSGEGFSLPGRAERCGIPAAAPGLLGTAPRSSGAGGQDRRGFDVPGPVAQPDRAAVS
ncbi:MAG TPA: RCC1 domain-containing protein [Anaeromyxobacter sp.]|nr:RCC1 domain-containing protein [Anaeromyxobacter sp.]